MVRRRCFEVRMTGVAWIFAVATRWVTAAMVVSDDVAVQELASANVHWLCASRWQMQHSTCPDVQHEPNFRDSERLYSRR